MNKKALFVSLNDLADEDGKQIRNENILTGKEVEKWKIKV